MIPENHIEAAVSVECRISLAIYVEREQWQKMTESEKVKLANEAIDRASRVMSDREFETGVCENAFVEITQGKLLSADNIEVYDPENDESS